MRTLFVEELKKVFDEASGYNSSGEITRKQFEKLIQGYFELKGIKSCRENFDKFFSKLDANKDKTIEFKEFISFADHVNEKEILPIIEKELKSRGLL